MNTKLKRILILNIPYLFLALVFTKVSQAWRLAFGYDIGNKVLNLMNGFRLAFDNPLPSLNPKDLLFGIAMALIIRLVVYQRERMLRNIEKG